MNENKENKKRYKMVVIMDDKRTIELMESDSLIEVKNKAIELDNLKGLEPIIIDQKQKEILYGRVGEAKKVLEGIG